jgi:hypothetical protein
MINTRIRSVVQLSIEHLIVSQIKYELRSNQYTDEYSTGCDADVQISH